MNTDTAHTALPNDLSIYEANALKKQLLDWMGEHPESDLVLDGSAVERVDLAGLQVLVLTQQVLVGNGHTMALMNASPPLHQALELLGLNWSHTQIL